MKEVGDLLIAAWKGENLGCAGKLVWVGGKGSNAGAVSPDAYLISRQYP